MLWVEWVLSPVYPVKSSAKALVFLGCAAAYVLASGDRTILRSFGRPEQGAMRLPLLLGATVPKALPVEAYLSYMSPQLRDRPYALAMYGVRLLLSVGLAALYAVLTRRLLRRMEGSGHE